MRPYINNLTLIFMAVVATVSVARSTSYAVDATFLPRLTERQQQAIVAVYDELASSEGTGFVVGHDNGRTLVLTADHCVDGGSIEVGLSDGRTVDDVTIVAESFAKDLALLAFTSRRPVPELSLAPADYPVRRRTPVTGVARAERRVLEHIGTYLRAGPYTTVDGVDAEYVDIAAYTPSGFSGGPYIVVDPTTRRNLVAGVITCGNDTTSSGPSIAEVQDFLRRNAGQLRPSLHGMATLTGSGTSLTGPPTGWQSPRQHADEDELLRTLFGP